MPGDPYFPKQGNDGWIEQDPKEDPEEIMEEDPKEDLEEEEDEEEIEEDSNAESEVINPPYVARVLAHRQGYQGPTPRWAENLEKWSRQQHQRSPYGMERGFYNLSHGGLADRALPVMVQQIAHLGDQTRASANRILELGATVEVTDP